jgi:hypothetical protein
VHRARTASPCSISSAQTHRRYRVDTKLKALFPRHRFSIDKEVEQDFPHLPVGCSIQLDRLFRQYVLENIWENLVSCLS